MEKDENLKATEAEEKIEDEEVDATDMPQQSETEKEEPKKENKPKNKKKDEIAKLKEEIENLKNENLKIKDEYLRARADMENTKRRLNEDALKTKKYASQGLIEQLITPVDMLVKVSNLENSNPELQNFLVGFKMISKQITDILDADGLKEIDALGKDFDPNLHHALEKEHQEGVEPGKVIQVLQTGYMYKDRLLKPAMVKVSE